MHCLRHYRWRRDSPPGQEKLWQDLRRKWGIWKGRRNRVGREGGNREKKTSLGKSFDMSLWTGIGLVVNVECIVLKIVNLSRKQI